MQLKQILKWRREREVNPTSTQNSFQKLSYMTWTLVNIKNIDILIMFIPVRDPGGLDIWHCRVSLEARGSSLGNACVYLTTVENLWRVRRCKQGCDFSNTPTPMLTFCAYTHRQTEKGHRSCSNFFANQPAHEIKACPRLSLPLGRELFCWGDRRLFRRER